MRRSRPRAATFLVLAAVALTGCGGDDAPQDDVGEDVAQPDVANEDDDGPLPMQPQDAGDEGDAPPMADGGVDPEPMPPGLNSNGAPQSPEAFARVEEARRQWVALGVTSYEMVIERICFCPSSGELRVTVEDGVVTGAAFTDPSRADEALQAELAPTIDQLLENAASVARGFEDVTAEIGLEEGLPVRGDVDAPMVADEEVSWTVRTFTPL